MADGQEDAVLASSAGWLSPAAPDDLPGERVDCFLLVAAQFVPLALRDDSGRSPDLSSLRFRELATPTRRLGVGVGYMSTTIVTGPSLTSSSCIRAPKMPVSTRRPSAASAAQNAS